MFELSRHGSAPLIFVASRDLVISIVFSKDTTLSRPVTMKRGRELLSSRMTGWRMSNRKFLVCRVIPKAARKWTSHSSEPVYRRVHVGAHRSSLHIAHCQANSGVLESNLRRRLLLATLLPAPLVAGPPSPTRA